MTRGLQVTHHSAAQVQGDSNPDTTISRETSCLVGEMPRGNHGGLALVPGLSEGGEGEDCPAHAEDVDYLHVSSWGAVACEAGGWGPEEA
jgi:hypothetical protein